MNAEARLVLCYAKDVVFAFLSSVLRLPTANKQRTNLSPVAILLTVVILTAHVTECNRSEPETG